VIMEEAFLMQYNNDKHRLEIKLIGFWDQHIAQDSYDSLQKVLNDIIDKQFTALKLVDDRIFKKLDKLEPLVWKAGVIFTLILTIIGSIVIKFLVG